MAPRMGPGPRGDAVPGRMPTQLCPHDMRSRLAQQLQRWPEATTALEAAAAAAPEGDLVTRAALLGELAAYYDLQLGDAPRAIAAYRRWLEVDGTNPTTVPSVRTNCGRWPPRPAPSRGTRA